MMICIRELDGRVMTERRYRGVGAEQRSEAMSMLHEMGGRTKKTIVKSRPAAMSTEKRNSHPEDARLKIREQSALSATVCATGSHLRHPY